MRRMILAWMALGMLIPIGNTEATIAPVNYQVDCVFNDSTLFEPVCEAAAHIGSSASGESREHSLFVFCSKSHPLYQGEATFQMTQDLATIRSSDSSNPALVVPRYPFDQFEDHEVSATLSISNRTYTGYCEIRPSL